MLETNPITLITIFLSLITCLWLCYRDFKDFLLPNVGVLALAILGIVFHSFEPSYSLTPIEIVTGFFVGGIFLMFIRWCANKYYQQDTMGMGDVKLMMAGGIWVGFPNILIALSVGAFAGAIIAVCINIIHNLGKDEAEKKSLAQEKIAAGPGFIAGLIICFIAMHMHLI